MTVEKEPQRINKAFGVWEISPWELARMLELENKAIFLQSGFVKKINFPDGVLIYPENRREHLMLEDNELDKIYFEDAVFRQTDRGLDFVCSVNFSNDNHCIFGTILKGGKLELFKERDEELPSHYLNLIKAARQIAADNLQHHYRNRVGFRKRGEESVPLSFI